jgi:ISXO2 transposase-like protein
MASASTSGDVTTNTIESYFSLLKRGINGVYHHVSPQHLKRSYVAEFDFRYNHRIALGVDDFDRTLSALLANAADMIGIPLGTMLIALFAADIGFIGFNYLTFTAKLVGKLQFAHRLAHTMRKEPCGLKANLPRASELVAGNAFLRRAKQIGRLQRLVQRNARVFENGADLAGELLTALAALPEPIADALRRD